MLETLLGSKLRSKVLGWLFTHPDERYFVRQLTSLVKEDSTNVSRELSRLEKTGILVSTTEGKQKYYQANRQSPLFDELRGLIVKTAGLADVLREALAPLAEQIAFAFVYGSMASGEANSASDIDLLVVGDIDEMALHNALSQAENRLGRPVNYTLMSQAEFDKRRSQKGGFLARVLSGLKIMIMGSIDEI
jgi:predicted nucleotidyltransferase